MKFFDTPRFSATLFFPEREPLESGPPLGAEDRFVAAEDGTPLRVRVHHAPKAPRDHAGVTLLCFPGNGEHAGSYDGIAPGFFLPIGGVAQVAVAEYRGYGKSGGTPTFSQMLADARHLARTFAAESTVILYGRSLGSQAACAALDAFSAANRCAALILDAGFSDLAAFVLRRGEDPHLLRMLEAEERLAIDPCARISAFEGPVLGIHGNEDRVIDCRDGGELVRASKNPKSRFALVQGRGHNDLFYAPEYFPTMHAFLREHAISNR